ncbi:NAD(+) diphosphatase [Cryobacterium melibiosiphilum]|uniref:NAD(+) diphosphatase n=1 Tax=Cryobacterium melibiosiphilum TaxID=995039 RepID=A0A3A5ME15_9MICO|nr:NAD(+) diphosphatase [Cryobacterium melibiosiphilum]RJT88370.1 NAD(+) diphosphatase [Cryobacterium melibiosiphilum]
MSSEVRSSDFTLSDSASFAFTARLPLSRYLVDRDHEARALPDLVATLWADAATRVVPLWNGTALVLPGDAREPHLAFLPPAILPPLDPTAIIVYLGRSLDPGAPEPVGTPLLAIELDDDQAASLESDSARWRSLRDLAATLGDRDTGVFAEALGLRNWHHSHRFCPRCGAAAASEAAGWVRRCTACGSQIFPRTDPAVIMLITDAADRLLLGSNALWENNRYSLLAGFVEPGESLEAAVLRESFEESGLRVTDATYLGSQPWPFPASIMCGFTARVASEQDPAALAPDGAEILDLRWFTRQELRAADASWLMLPGPSSIAHAMIEQWLAAG